MKMVIFFAHAVSIKVENSSSIIFHNISQINLLMLIKSNQVGAIDDIAFKNKCIFVGWGSQERQMI